MAFQRETTHSTCSTGILVRDKAYRFVLEAFEVGDVVTIV